MHIIKKFLPLLSGFLLFSCASEKINYASISAMQDVQIPEWEISRSDPKTVLFIFPHPDDEITCAGTMAKMRAAGWKIQLLTLTLGAPADTAVRLAEWNAAKNVMGIDRAVHAGFYNNSWNAVLGDSLLFWNDHQPEIRSLIAQTIEQFQPDILVTYDDAIGGYGHPEHRITAQLTREIFMAGQTDPAFPAHQLYQSTLPDALEHFMLNDLPVYHTEMQRTGSDGLPAPTVAVTITEYWGLKKAAAECYASQRDILTKFYLLPGKNQEQQHFRAFNREYFTLVKP